MSTQKTPTQEKPSEPAPEYLSLSEYAALYNISEKTVRMLCAKGRLESLDFGVGRNKMLRIPRDARPLPRGKSASSQSVAQRTAESRLKKKRPAKP